MSEALVYVDRSVIRSRDLAGLRRAVADLTDFVREREPQLTFYGFDIDEGTATFSVVAVHPDSTSLAVHLGIGAPEFRKVGAFIELQQIEVFGTPSDAVLEQLHEKAAMLGSQARVTVHKLAAGFDRLSPVRR